MTQKRQRPFALLVLSGGGFSFETKCLLKATGDAFDFIYLLTEYGGTPGQDDIPGGEAHRVPSFATVTRSSILISVNAFLTTFTKAAILLARKPIDLVIVVGCSHAVPTLLAGRLFGRRTVFVESITRVARLSNTGKLVYRLRLAGTYLIQWPDLQKRYPASRLGTIL